MWWAVHPGHGVAFSDHPQIGKTRASRACLSLHAEANSSVHFYISAVINYGSGLHQVTSGSRITLDAANAGSQTTRSKVGARHVGWKTWFATISLAAAEQCARRGGGHDEANMHFDRGGFDGHATGAEHHDLTTASSSSATGGTGVGPTTGKALPSVAENMARPPGHVTSRNSFTILVTTASSGMSPSARYCNDDGNGRSVFDAG